MPLASHKAKVQWLLVLTLAFNSLVKIQETNLKLQNKANNKNQPKKKKKYFEKRKGINNKQQQK